MDLEQEQEQKQPPVDPKPEQGKEAATGTQTTRDPETGELISQEKNDGKAD